MLKPESDVLVSQLDRVLGEHVARGIVGASLALVRPGEEVLTLAAGCADRETGAPLTPAHLFKTASTKKTWTAVAVHALVSEGRIGLDRTIEGWFPHLPRANEIRVRHLLSHRSGLPEYESFMPKGAADDWTPQRIVEFALANGTQIAPGEAFVYSNPGYVLAGEIVASERGEPLSRWLRREVFAPCGMAETWSGGDEDFPRARLARQYVFDSSAPGVSPEDSSDWFPLSGIGAAGDLVTTPRDLARGFHALFTGQVLDGAALADLTGPLLSRRLSGHEHHPLRPRGPGLPLRRPHRRGPPRPAARARHHGGPPRGQRDHRRALPELVLERPGGAAGIHPAYAEIGAARGIHPAYAEMGSFRLAGAPSEDNPPPLPDPLRPQGRTRNRQVQPARARMRPGRRPVAGSADCLRGEVPIAALCEDYGISRKTAYGLGRYREGGPAGLLERSRAPHRHGRRRMWQRRSWPCAVIVRTGAAQAARGADARAPRGGVAGGERAPAAGPLRPVPPRLQPQPPP